MDIHNMPDQEIHSANIKIFGADDTGQQIKIRDQNKQTYSFFKNKKDGGETEAFKSYQQYKIGDVVMITYKDVPYKNSTIKNVMTLRQATGEPDAAPATAAAQWQARSGQRQGQNRPEREYWERREAKRQSSILLQVAFKAATALQAAKIRSGEAENRDWLYDTTLEFYDWMESHMEDSSPASQQTPDAARAMAEESRNDEILF
jgi:hypothetical protein